MLVNLGLVLASSVLKNRLKAAGCSNTISANPGSKFNLLTHCFRSCQFCTSVYFRTLEN